MLALLLCLVGCVTATSPVWDHSDSDDSDAEAAARPKPTHLRITSFTEDEDGAGAGLLGRLRGTALLEWSWVDSAEGEPPAAFLVGYRQQGRRRWDTLEVYGEKAWVPALKTHQNIKYMFRVVARFFEGELSKYSDVLFVDVPFPPKNLAIMNYNLVAESNNSIEVSNVQFAYETPEYDGGAPVYGYLLEFRRRGGARWQRRVTSHTRRRASTRPGLEFRLRALNMLGTSKPSNVAHVGEPPSTRADAAL